MQIKQWFKKYGSLIGINPYRTIKFSRRFPQFLKDYRALKKNADDKLHQFPFGSIYPCLFDKDKKGGKYSGHYFHQDLLIASKINEYNPERHIDIGSRIDGFVAHVASFRKIEIADIRDIRSSIQNIYNFQLDITKPLPVKYIECTDSLSCLHVIEHFGLGRYGDQIQWDGYIVGFNNLTKMLKENGKLYISTPIGSQRIEFNAHRVFAVETLIKMFSKDFLIESFSYVNDSGELFTNVELTESNVKNNFGCRYGCGIFQLVKKGISPN